MEEKTEICFKKSTYGLVELSWIQRCILLKKYNLLDEEDQAKDHVTMI